VGRGKSISFFEAKLPCAHNNRAFGSSPARISSTNQIPPHDSAA
jgi:hypothetical protein